MNDHIITSNMKKITTFFLAIILASPTFTQTDAQRIDSAKAFISRQQYLSAYTVLTGAKESSAALFSTAIEIMLRHSVSTNNYYDKFSLEDKTVDNKRIADQISFPLEETIINCMKLYPGNCNFHGYLYEFYNYVLTLEDRFYKLEYLAEIKDIIKKLMTPACPHYLSYYVLGYAHNYLGHPDSSVSLLQQSIALDKNFGLAWYELGNAYFLTNNTEAALKNAKKAFELSTKRYDKSKAALLMGKIYEGKNDNTNALFYYVMADTLYRKNFFNAKALLNFYVKTGDPKAEDATNAFLGSQGRDNLHHYIDIFEIYSMHKKENDLAAFCIKSLDQFSYRKEVTACLNFTLGKIYQKMNASLAKEYFKKAKEQGITASRYPVTRNHPATAKEVDAAFKNLN
jgi:tetratricopeptide (TPR) repeat protein